MKSRNEIAIHAPYDRIFPLAAKVEEWGRILPHYRYVKLLRREGNRKWVRMSAWRDIVPVTWTAIESVEEGTEAHPGTIKFRHIGGMVRGMDVQWSFEPRPERGEVVVSIYHQLDDPPFPVKLLGSRLIEAIVGRGFIGNIARKTLKRIKELAEQDVVEDV
ncbi:MAG TPA: SRPBCC family protein [Chloroflexia bacterium]|nr:SRPBCC family protein [Chloroflexia bacterium]